MHAIYDLKDMLCKELEDYGKKGELSAGTLDIVDKLAHTIKNLDKIIEFYEEDEYSNAMGGMRGRSYRDNSYNDGGYERSYARGRGSYARRDSMGRYSREGYSRAGDMADRLRELMNDAPDEHTRQEIQRLVTKMEQM